METFRTTRPLFYLMLCLLGGPYEYVVLIILFAHFFVASHVSERSDHHFNIYQIKRLWARRHK